MSPVISDANITSMVRSLIGEATAEYWTDAEITLYIKFAMININSRYWYLLAPTEAKVTQKDLTASQEYITPPTDCAKILRIEVASDRKLLRKIEADELWKYSVSDDHTASSNYFNVWYLEYYDATTDFPEALRPLIAVEAAMLAKAKDENVDQGLFDLYKRFEDTAIAFLATDTLYESSILGDYEQEQSYTDTSPVAWAFRDGKVYLYKVYDED